MRPPLLLLLLLPLLVLASASQPRTSVWPDTPRDNRRETPRVCDIRCCQTQPNCWHATSVTCDCPDTNLMTLQSGLFPDTIRNVTIAGVWNITIVRGAIAWLHQLEELRIEGSRTVHVKTHGLQQHEGNRLRRLTIFRVSSVTIDESAFSGQWNTGTRVFISAVNRMTVAQHGFSHSSDTSGPNLHVGYVSALGLSPAAIAAPISTLFILNVHMDVCHEDSVGGGHVSQMLFTNSSITVANAGCVKDVKSLNIISTSFTTIQKGAFSGKFTYVRITNSTMTSVQKGGFHIEVGSFHVNNTFIDTLESSGFSVRATGSIFLNQVTVRVMKQYALFGLTRGSSTTSWPVIRIHGLSVTQQADDGSLAFAADAPVELADLTVAPRQPPVCPTEQWTRQLTGVAEDGRLTPNQRKVYEQLARSQSCTVDENRPRTEDTDSRDDTDRTSPPDRQPGTQATPRDDTQPRSEDPDSRDDTDRTPPPVDATVVPGEERAVPPPDPASRGGTASGPVLYSILGAVGALAVGVAACLLVRRHRRRTDVAAGGRGGKQQPPAVRVHPQYVSTENADQPTQRHLPDVCDYAEPLAVLQGDGDYAELPTAPPAGDYAESLAARQGDGGYAEPLAARQADGDYAEIPVSADYAEPVLATAGRESECGDYAEVLMLHRRHEGPADARTSLYATVQPSPAEAAAPAKRRLSGSEEVPPLPPVTAERLQTPANVTDNMTDNMTDNVLYAPGNMTDNALYAETK